jgi:hypothetical protein
VTHPARDVDRGSGQKSAWPSSFFLELKWEQIAADFAKEGQTIPIHTLRQPWFSNGRYLRNSINWPDAVVW